MKFEPSYDIYGEPNPYRSKMKELCNSYNERIKAIMSGTNDNFNHLEIGSPIQKLIDAGFPDLPIQVSVQTLTVKVSQENHPFKLLDILHMPEFVCDPIAVFRSATTVADRKVFLTEMEADGVNILVVIQPYQIFKGVTVNSIRSIYPKNNIKPVLEWICLHRLMEYCNQEKILKWLSKHQYNPGDVTKLLEDSVKLINSM